MAPPLPLQQHNSNLIPVSEPTVINLFPFLSLSFFLGVFGGKTHPPTRGKRYLTFECGNDVETSRLN